MSEKTYNEHMKYLAAIREKLEKILAKMGK